MYTSNDVITAIIDQGHANIGTSSAKNESCEMEGPVKDKYSY
jgi:hypothetical protein